MREVDMIRAALRMLIMLNVPRRIFVRRVRIFRGAETRWGIKMRGWYYRKLGQYPVYLGKNTIEALARIEHLAKPPPTRGGLNRPTRGKRKWTTTR